MCNNLFQNNSRIEKGDSKEFRQKEAEKFIDYVKSMGVIPDFININFYYGLSDMQDLSFGFTDEEANIIKEEIKIILKIKKLIDDGFNSNTNIAIRYHHKYLKITDSIFGIHNFLNLKLFENFVDSNDNGTIILNLSNYHDLSTEFRETLLWYICYLIRRMIRTNYKYEIFIFNTHSNHDDDKHQEEDTSKSNQYGLDYIMLNRNGIDKNLLEFSIEFLNKVGDDDSIFKLYWDGMNLYLITNPQSDWDKPQGEEIEIQPNISLVISEADTFIDPSLSLINMNTIMKLEKEIDGYKEKISNVIKDFDIDSLTLHSCNSAILYVELFHRTKETDLYHYSSLVNVNKYLDELADTICKIFPNRDRNDITEKVFCISPLNIFDNSNDSIKHELVSEAMNYLRRLSLMNKLMTFSNYNNFVNMFIKSQKSVSEEIYLYKIKLIIFRYIASIVEGN